MQATRIKQLEDANLKARETAPQQAEIQIHAREQALREEHERQMKQLQMEAKQKMDENNKQLAMMKAQMDKLKRQWAI